MTIRVILADDHRMFREALRVALDSEPDIEIVGEAGSAEQTLAVIEAIPADVVLLDIALPDQNGIELARRIAKAHPALRIVALSGYAERLFVEGMLEAGASAYVVKSAGADELLMAIRAAMKGQVFLSPDVTASVLGRRGGSATPPLSVLAPREKEVLRLLAKGLSSPAISGELKIATATVDVYRRNIKRKLGLASVAELTRYAVREGLLAI